MNAKTHCYTIAFSGTAKHLRLAHNLKDELIDDEDHYALVHDHAVLHGATISSTGLVSWPKDKKDET